MRKRPKSDGGQSHYVDVYEPTEAEGSRGERQGSDRLVRQGVPCSAIAVAGSEGEQARGTYGDMNFKVTMQADRLRPITNGMYLTGGTLGARQWHIAFVNDIEQKGFSLELLCGELLTNG